MRRYKQNVSLLTSGDIDNVALVVERLLRRKRQKGLSAGETRMLRRAVQILDSELQFRRHGGSDGELGGVREPRTPRPLPSAGGMALPIPPEVSEARD